MLLLKLLVIPTFLLLISRAGRRWGPSVAGWLSGLPVVVGPILLFLAVEQGELFAAQSATAALAAMFAMIAFCVVYAQVAQHRNWPWALGIALGVWALVALILSWLPASLPLSSLIALVALLAAPYLFPTVRPVMNGPAAKSDKLLLRMIAGALLTLAVTLLASTVGERWSGLLAVFPVLGSVMAVFSQQTRGPAFTAAAAAGDGHRHVLLRRLLPDPGPRPAGAGHARLCLGRRGVDGHVAGDPTPAGAATARRHRTPFAKMTVSSALALESGATPMG